MTQVAFADGAMAALRRELLSSSPNESAAILLAGISQRGSASPRLTVIEWSPVQRDGYRIQEPDRLEVDPASFAPMLKRARAENLAFLFAHSHPKSSSLAFSMADDIGEDRLMPVLFSRARSAFHGNVIVGHDGIIGRLRGIKGQRLDVTRFADIGETIELANEPRAASVSPEYDRTVRAFGKEGQHRLSEICVGIVGLGGTGSLVAQQLAHLGVKEFLLLDPDTIETSNLNRLVGATPSDVGKAKVSIAKAMIRRIAPDAKVTATRGSSMEKRIGETLLSCDAIFCCTDNHGSRAFLNQVAYQYYIPVFDMGVRIDASGGRVSAISGRVEMLAPGRPCLVCERLLDPEAVRRDFLTPTQRALDPYIVGANEPHPSVISLNATVSSLSVTMFLGAVTNAPLAARHQLYLGQQGVVRVVRAEAQINCVVCSRNGALGRGDSWPLPWGAV